MRWRCDMHTAGGRQYNNDWKQFRLLTDAITIHFKYNANTKIVNKSGSAVKLHTKSYFVLSN